MPRKQNYYSDEFESNDEELLTQRRSKSALGRSSSTKSRKSSRRPASAKVTRSSSSAGRTARQMWLDAVGTGNTGKRKKTAVEAWSDTLRKTGVGITTETTKHSSISGLDKNQSRNMAYGSTSHYLRQLVGTERNRKVGDMPAHKPAPGTPAYKSPEEYYDDILELKKQIAALNNENSTSKSKLRRLEEDNLKKEREIEQLLDPTKSDELRRTLADRKPDAGSVIHSLKQKILKLEHSLRDKESAFSKLQSDLKSTKAEEMKMQLETFYQEIIRLNQLKTVEPINSHRPPKNGFSTKENTAKLKALQQTILRMNEKNVVLMSENKSLKEDLEKMMQEKLESRHKHAEYEDMSKKQLLGAISKLEKKLDRADADSMSLMSDIDERRGNREGKIILEGTMAQKLDQLDRRETELLEELDKQRNIIKRLKDDRMHYRNKTEEKEKEMKALKKEIDDLQAELDSFYEKDKHAITPRSARQPKRVMGNPSTNGRRSSTTPVRKSHSPVETHTKRNNREIEKFRENHAAKTIQRSWRGHKKYQEEEDAAELIGSAMRGHINRKKTMHDYHEESDEMTSDADLDDAAEVIQSSVHGYWSRKNNIKKRQSSPTNNRRSQSRRLNSEGEEEDDSELNFRQHQIRPHSGRHSPKFAQPRNKPPASPRNRHNYRTNRYDGD